MVCCQNGNIKVQWTDRKEEWIYYSNTFNIFALKHSKFYNKKCFYFSLQCKCSSKHHNLPCQAIFYTSTLCKSLSFLCILYCSGAVLFGERLATHFSQCFVFPIILSYFFAIRYSLWPYGACWTLIKQDLSANINLFCSLNQYIMAAFIWFVKCALRGEIVLGTEDDKMWWRVLYREASMCFPYQSRPMDVKGS